MMERYQLSSESHTLLESLSQPFALCRLTEGRFVPIVLSDGFCRLFGYPDRARAYDDLAADLLKNVHPDDAARVGSAAARFAEAGGTFEAVCRARKKDGYFTVRVTGEHVLLDDGVRLAQFWFSAEEAIAPEEQSAGIVYSHIARRFL